MPEPFYQAPQTSNVTEPVPQSAIDPSIANAEANYFPINPFFPPLNAAAASPQKRRRTDPFIEQLELYARGNDLSRQDIFAEVETLANLEVLTTR